MVGLATFGAGCFWGVEKTFARKFVNLQACVGYCGGQDLNVNYRQVCSGTTGHAEVVQLQGDFDFKELVDFFFRTHDPTTVNRQGADSGSQYRSTIFYHDENQKDIAEKFIAEHQQDFGGRIKTTVEKYDKFVRAEDYHQDYLTVNPHGYECATHFERSWTQVRNMFSK